MHSKGPRLCALAGDMASSKVTAIWLLVSLFLVDKVVEGRHLVTSVTGSMQNEPRQVRKSNEFPEGFRFGTSSSAYQ